MAWILFFDGSAFQAQLNRIEAALAAIQKKENSMALSLQTLIDAVAAEKTAEDSAITLLNGLTAQIQQLIAASGNTVDPAQLQTIVDGIKAETTTLAAAVTANTPAVTP